MSVNSVSFWQQDRTYWSQQQNQSAAASANDAVINTMAQAETNLGQGLASIANQAALQRVNTEISSLVEQVLNPSGSSTSSSSSNSSSSSGPGSASTSGTPGAPATAISTARLTTDTSLSSLGILPGGTITISAGTNGTTYTSTGTDTVGDLIDAINVDLPTNANVTASFNGSGQFVITSRNKSDTIAIVGSGTDAAAIGFGVGNNTFEPTKPTSSAPSTSSSSSASSPSTGSSSNGASNSAGSATSSSTGTSNALPSYLALTEQGLSTAAGIFSAAGVSGTLVNLLA